MRLSVSATGAVAGVDAAPTCLSGDLSWLLSQAHYALASEVANALAPAGLTLRANHVLGTALTGTFTQTELADTVGLDKTTMVATLDELERDGLAERRASPTDRRARVVSVTEAGAAKVAQGRAIIARVQDDVLGALPLEQRAVFEAALRQLVAGRLSEPVQCTLTRRREVRA